MTLRDYFAAAVLGGVFSRESLQSGDFENKITIADFCFKMADVMIERRSEKKYKTAVEALAAKEGD
jgi:hypothetical protein